MKTLAVLTIFRKELAELRRDRKSLMAVLGMVLISGPLMLAMIYFGVSSQKNQLATQTVVIANLAQAPELVDFLERAGIRTESAPADYQRRLRDGSLPLVLEVDQHFRADVAAGQRGTVRLLADSSRSNFDTPYRRLRGALDGFDHGWGNSRLILRGVAPQTAHPLNVEEVDFASANNRVAKLIGNMLAMYTLIAGMMGSLAAALELTAAERERQSLEPLMTLPIQPWQIALGKWLAASLYNLTAMVGCLLAYLLTLNLVPLPEVGLTLRFGWQEALGFLVVSLPVAVLLPAGLLLFGSFGKTVKEAQSVISIGLAMLTVLPALTMFRTGPPAPWQEWMPVSSHMQAMDKILRAETLEPMTWLALWLAPLALTLLAVYGLSRNLANEKLLSSR